MRPAFLTAALLVPLVLAAPSLDTARDRQDLPALEKLAGEFAAAARKNPKDAGAQYRLALADSYLSEVAFQLRDRSRAAAAAEDGIRAAREAVALKPAEAENHRILGTLCGQVIPANLLSGLKYGRCAKESIDKAIQLDPKSAAAYLSRGVGNYYLPPALGGGLDAAIRDFEKAIQLDPKSAYARLWLGIALRKANRSAEARQAIAKALELNPDMVWAKQQLEKTPAR